jgi:hypothetical protein
LKLKHQTIVFRKRKRYFSGVLDNLLADLNLSLDFFNLNDEMSEVVSRNFDEKSITFSHFVLKSIRQIASLPIYNWLMSFGLEICQLFL